MKHTIIGILAIVVFICFSSQSWSEETIIISTEDYPPHTSPDLNHYGLNCHIVTEAFALEGITVKYRFYPGKRSYITAKEGKTDGTVPWVWRKDRAEHFYYPDPVHTAGFDSFFHLKTVKPGWNPEKPNFANLAGLKIGGVIGHNYGELFQNAEKSGIIEVERVATTIQNFRKLLAGRIQLYLVEDSVGYYKLHKNFSKTDVELITHIRKNTNPAATYHLIISKKSKKGIYFVNAFNNGLRKLKESGRFDQFVKASMQGDYILKKP